MNDEAAFTRAMQEHPDDAALRLIFADWLEEQSDPRGELIRLLHKLTQSVEVPNRRKVEERLRSLLAAGVQPVGPFITNSIGMEFAWVPAGTFLMGSPETEQGRHKSETQHRVTLTKGLFLAVHPVTQSCWQEVMSNNPSHFRGDDLPVDTVSWDDCQEFLRKLSEREDQSYRLPTEAEWEFACRAGMITPFYFGDVISTNEANFDGNYPYGEGKKGVYREKTTSVGSFQANALGLHDMHGNLWEWCADRYAENAPGEAVEHQGPQEGDSRVLRGGSFADHAVSVRSANRLRLMPSTHYHIVGFRAAMNYTP